MFSLWYLSLAIDEYRRNPVFKTASVETNGKAQQPSSPVVPAQKDNNKIENQAKKAEEKIDIAIKTPEPKKEPEPELKPKPIKDPFDAKLNELVNKQQPKLPAKEQFDEKLAEISSILSPTSKAEVKAPEFNRKPSPNVEIPDKTPKTPPASPSDEKQTQDTYPTSNFPEPFEATLAEFSSDFDAATFDAPKPSNTFKQFQEPFDTKLTELNSKLNKTCQPLSNVDTLQEEDPLDRKLRELSTKYNEKLESTKNIKLPDLESTFEDITRLS